MKYIRENDGICCFKDLDVGDVFEIDNERRYIKAYPFDGNSAHINAISFDGNLADVCGGREVRRIEGAFVEGYGK